MAPTPCIGCGSNHASSREISKNGEYRCMGSFCDDCTDYLNGERSRKGTPEWNR